MKYTIKGIKKTRAMEDALIDVCEQRDLMNKNIIISIEVDKHDKVVAKAFEHKTNVSAKAEGNDYYVVINQLAHAMSEHIHNDHKKRYNKHKGIPKNKHFNDEE